MQSSNLDCQIIPTSMIRIPYIEETESCYNGHLKVELHEHPDDPVVPVLALNLEQNFIDPAPLSLPHQKPRKAHHWVDSSNQDPERHFVLVLQDKGGAFNSKIVECLVVRLVFKL